MGYSLTKNLGDIKMRSERIKNQATCTKRTATSICNVVAQLERENTLENSVGISEADRAILIKAASILSKISSVKTQAAKKTKSAEVAKEIAIRNATAEAKSIIAKWQVPSSNLDKIALISCGDECYSLESYLKTGLYIFKRETTSKDWLQQLDELVSDANQSIPASAAYSAISLNKPVSEVMVAAADKLIAIKSQQRTLSLAEKWSAKIN